MEESTTPPTVMPQVHPYTSPEYAEIMAALAKAQGAFEQLEKSRTAKIPLKSGGSYSYKYADLSDAVDSVRKALAANGLSFSQDERGGYLWTFLYHSSGQWMAGKVKLFPGNTPQTHGSGLTYARRYGLCNLLGIVAEEDDDGRVSEDERKSTKPQTRDKGNPLISDAQGKRLWAIAKKQGYTEALLRSVIKNKTGQESIKGIPFIKYESVVKYVEANPVKEIAKNAEITEDDERAAAYADGQ